MRAASDKTKSESHPDLFHEKSLEPEDKMKNTNKMLFFACVIISCLILAFAAPVNAQTWDTKSPMPGTGAWGGGIINGTFYSLNIDMTTRTNNVVMYDPVTNIWTTKAPLPQFLGEWGVGIIGDKIYVVGGCINTDCRIGTTNLVYVYDSTTDSWSAGIPMPSARNAVAAGVIEGKLYVAGGNDGSTALSILNVYDPATGSWTSKASMPSPVFWPTVGVINNKLFVAGGFAQGFNIVSTLYVYDPTTDSWETKAPIPAPTVLAAGGVLNNVFYVIGGNTGNMLTAVVRTYDPSTDTWTTVTPLPSDAQYGATASINGVLYVAGQLDATGKVLPTFAFTPPNLLPVALCKDVTVQADSACSATASIDNGSYDPDGDSITLVQSPAGPYPKGNTSVTLTVTDGTGASSQCTGTVSVVDNMPPAISAVTVTPSLLWPPNHKLVEVTIGYAATDNCGQPSCLISSVTSNEPISGSDYTVIDAHHLKLSAERLGSGNGRIYTSTITCTDSSANSSSQTATVTVPHDQRNH